MDRINRNFLSRRTFVGIAAVAGAQMAVFGLSGCASEEGATGSSSPSGSYTPGTYEANALGKFNDVTISATFSEDKITEIEVTNHYETTRIAQPAVEGIPTAIVEHQSLGVDTVTGATLTSLAILNAVASCVDEAGGDSEALRKVPVETSAPQEVQEISADVVIVGAGGSGMGAAMAAATAGAQNVVVVEKSSNIGGNALVSGGFLYYIAAPDDFKPDNNGSYDKYIDDVMAAESTKIADPSIVSTVEAQLAEYRASGNTKVFDSKEYFCLDFAATSGEGTPVEGYIKESNYVSNYTAWLTNLGFEWSKPLFGIVGYMYPRWTMPVEGFGGEGYFDFYDEMLDTQSLPVNILLDTAAQDLIIEYGKVVGINAQTSTGETYRITAPQTILATGGFSGNPDMLREYNTFWNFDDSKTIPTTNVYGHTGDGIKMALDAGGTVDAMDNQMLFPFNSPATMSADDVAGYRGDAVVVNKEGKRFVDETSDRFTLSGAIMEQTDQLVYMLSDKNQIEFYKGPEFEEVYLERDQLLKADTLEGLAEAIGCPADALKETLDQFNANVDAQAEDEFGRYYYTENSKVLEGPFYAAPCTWAAHITIGGVVVDTDNHVLSGSGETIEGLYAVGELANERLGLSSMGDGVYAAQKIFGAISDAE